MKHMALATSVLAATLLAAGGASAQGFDGNYAGGYLADNSTGSNGGASFGGFMGYNFSFGPNLLGGVEEQVDVAPNPGWGSGTAISGTVSARAGYDLGQALVYGKLGAGYSSASTGYWVLGAGVDYQLSGRAFLRAEADRIDPSKSGLSTGNQILLGVGLKF